MGGEITVSSQLGKGSIFILNVEIKEGNLETVKGKNVKRVLNIDKSEAPCRILVVDDKATEFKAMELGADAYLKKPFSYDKLEEHIIHKVNEVLKLEEKKDK